MIESCARRRVYWAVWRYYLCLHREQFGNKRTASGFGYSTATGGKRCETDETSKLKFLLLVIECCAKTRAYWSLCSAYFCLHCVAIETEEQTAAVATILRETVRGVRPNEVNSFMVSFLAIEDFAQMPAYYFLWPHLFNLLCLQTASKRAIRDSRYGTARDRTTCARDEVSRL